MQNGEIEVIDGDDLEQPVVDLGGGVLPVPRPRAARVASDVEEEDAVRAVRLQLVGVVDAVALQRHVVHETAPLLLEQVLAAFHPVEQEVARPRGELLRLVVARPNIMFCC